MYIYIHIYIYTYIHTYVCIYTYMYIRVCMYMPIYTHIYMYIWICLRICTYLYFIYIYMYGCMSVKACLPRDCCHSAVQICCSFSWRSQWPSRHTCSACCPATPGNSCCIYNTRKAIYYILHALYYVYILYIISCILICDILYTISCI